MKLKKLVSITMGISVGIIILSTGRSQAALQANPTTHATPKSLTGTNWITVIRQMEETGQTMGLTEIIDTETKLGTTESNNIDVHMIKTTEYGAMAILSASGYGNSEKLQDSEIKTTTGNVTGVYVTGDRWEWTASNWETGPVGVDTKQRYYDLYTGSEDSAKIGDALGANGCKGWHGASYAWLRCRDSLAGRPGFIVGNQGIFSVSGYSYWHVSSSSAQGAGFNTNGYAGRGVAVVGSGL